MFIDLLLSPGILIFTHCSSEDCPNTIQILFTTSGPLSKPQSTRLYSSSFVAKTSHIHFLNPMIITIFKPGSSHSTSNVSALTLRPDEGAVGLHLVLGKMDSGVITWRFDILCVCMCVCVCVCVVGICPKKQKENVPKNGQSRAI